MTPSDRHKAMDATPDRTQPASVTSPPWPVALLTGLLGSGKTTLIRALLTRDGMADTMVVVNEFASVGIDHTLIAAVHGDVVLLRGGCLCCAVRQDLARTLRDLHLQWRSGAVPGFARVIIETSGLAAPGPVVATLGAHPLVRDAYALRGITSLVDAEYGFGELGSQAVGRHQAAVADRLLVSKPDRCDGPQRLALEQLLRGLNPVASIGTSLFGDAAAQDLFAAPSWHRPLQRLTAEAVEPAAGHRNGIHCSHLACSEALHWPSLQRWLASLLGQVGDDLLRLKAILDVAGCDRPVVLQAVHHTVYPAEVLPEWRGDRASTLVLISKRALPLAITAGFEACTRASGRG